MSAGRNSDSRQDPAEKRAEELVERLVRDGSRLVNSVAGRVREEVEDIVAEARTRSRRPRDTSDE